jgi:hypothetical protein
MGASGRNGVLVAAVWVGLAAVGTVAAADVEVRTECGTGLAGKSVERGVTVLFRSCVERGAIRSRVWKVVDRVPVPMTELLHDPATSSTTLWIGGIEVTGANTASEIEAFEAVVGSPEAALARKLGAELLAMGFDRGHRPLQGVLMNGLAYPDPAPSPHEGLVTGTLCSDGCCSPTTGCHGCCGSGCIGCVGLCSDACRAHDDCVRARRTWSYGCVLLFAAAVDSISNPLAPGRCTCAARGT